MVPPFALATGGGSYLLLPLLVYTTLFFLALHCVKSSQPLATWIDRSIDFDLTAGDDCDNDNTMRRLWDPGIRSTRARQRVWDPGIDPPESTPWLTACSKTRCPCLLLLLRYQSRLLLFLHTWLFHSLPSLRPLRAHAFIDGAAPTVDREWDPGIDSPCRDGAAVRDPFSLRPTRVDGLRHSLFYYCHPVLSRPTMPNIDS